MIPSAPSSLVLWGIGVTSSQGSYIDALRHRAFRLLTIAQTQSMIGVWAYSVALVVFVYAETASPGWVAASALA